MVLLKNLLLMAVILKIYLTLDEIFGIIKTQESFRNKVEAEDKNDATQNVIKLM
jgi:hypothetical protein